MKTRTLFDDLESRELDRITIEDRGFSGTELMGFAALSVFKAWEHRFLSANSVVILSGSGNNGGDGYALAQFLRAEGLSVSLFCKEGNFSKETIHYKNLTSTLGIPSLPLSDFFAEKMGEGTLIVDALLGTGFSGTLQGDIAKAVSEISEAKKRLGEKCFLLSLDTVSGYSAADPIPFQADAIAEIGCPKVRNVFYPLEKEKKSFHAIGFLREEFPTRQRLFSKAEPDELKSYLGRDLDSHKYKNGSAVFIGGSEGMAGAILSASLAFQELGGGISQILSPSPNVIHRILKKDPSFMVSILGKDPLSSSFGKKAKVVAIGPGLSSAETPKLKFPLKAKLILDAGALSAYSNEPLGPETILTPHIGEWAQIQGKNYPSLYSALEDARNWTVEKQSYLLLKGSVSVLFTPEGIAYFWDYQEPKLAVMGTGDLLVGVLSYFLAKGEETVEAVRLAQSVLLYCARACKGYPTAARMRKKIRDLLP